MSRRTGFRILFKARNCFVDVNSEDFKNTARMHRLIRIFTCRHGSDIFHVKKRPDGCIMRNMVANLMITEEPVRVPI